MTNYSTTHQQQQDISDHLLLRDKDKATMTEPKKPELKIMLIGKTGVGKTSSMNTLMGREPVKSLPCASSDTTKCKSETREFDDCKLVIIDTPGMLHTGKTKADVEKTLKEAILLAAPGVHMFLLVTTHHKEGQEDMDSWKILQEMFGKNTKDYTMALFTKGDIMKRSLSQDDFDRRRIKDFSVDCHTFDNKKNTIPDQVPELLKKINSFVQGREEKKKMYTNEMFEKAQELKEMEKKRREEQEKQGKKPDADEEENLNELVEKILSQLVGEKNYAALLHFSKLIQNTIEKHC